MWTPEDEIRAIERNNALRQSITSKIETFDQYQKRMAQTGYRSTLCDVKSCTNIASHKTGINDVPHGVVIFHMCSEHYDRFNDKTWEEFHPHVKAFNEFKG